MKRPAETDHSQSPKRKKVKFAADAGPEPRAPAKENSASGSGKAAKPALKKKQPTALEKLAARAEGSSSRSFSSSVPSRKGPRSQQEKEEDAYIAYMEKKLGWNKGGERTGKYGKGLEEDGLDGRSCFLEGGWRTDNLVDLLKDIDNLETSIFSSQAVRS